jgi:hypothetical protein
VGNRVTLYLEGSRRITGDGNDIELSAARAAASPGVPATGANGELPMGTKITVVGWPPLNTGQTSTAQVPERPEGARMPLVKGAQWHVDGVPVGICVVGEEEEDPEKAPPCSGPCAGWLGALPEPDTETFTVFPLSDAVAPASATPANTASTAPTTTSAENPFRPARRLDRCRFPPGIRSAVRPSPPTDATAVAR